MMDLFFAAAPQTTLLNPGQREDEPHKACSAGALGRALVSRPRASPYPKIAPPPSHYWSNTVRGVPAPQFAL